MEATFKILGLAILAAGLLLMRKRLIMGLRSQSWPATNGVVISAERVFSGTSVEDGEPTYNVKVEYSYMVDGREYHGDLIEPLPSLKSAEQAARVVDRYRPGAEVEIFFDPADPSQSLLVPGLDGVMKIFLVVYLACMILLAISLFVKTIHSDGL